VATLVAVLADGVLEGAHQIAHAAVQDVGETDEERQPQPAPLQVTGQLVQVDARPARPERRHLDVPGVADAEVAAAPTADVVQLGGVFDGPATDLAASAGLLQWSPFAAWMLG